MATQDIKYLFEPRSVAIIGASHNKNKIGYKIVENIIDSKYSGKVYPVNPKDGEILGLRVYKSLDEIDDEIDVACITIPAKYTFDAVKDCGRKGVKFLVIITSGFAEIGNIEEERKIVSYAREHGMRVLGPNIFGVYSSKAPINATFGPKDVKPGNIAIITQSGALGIAMLGKTKAENIGVSAVVSVGNKSDINETDLLEWFVSDKNTKVILMYIEGVKNGERLVSVLKKATKKKPIVVIKSGRSKRGAMAAASHTGSLAGSDEVFSDIMKQCGVLRAESVQEALDWCKFLANSSIPRGENTVIITNGGGIGVMGADACEKYNVHLFDDIQTLKKVFSDMVPEFGSVKNPVDLTGQATVRDYTLALNAALRNKDVHSIICMGCETAVFDAEKLTYTIEKMFSENKVSKPIVFSFFGGEKTEKLISYLRSNEIPAFSDVYDSISCLGAMYVYYRNITYPAETHNDVDEVEMDYRAIEDIIKKARRDKRHILLSYEGESIMRAADIRVPKSYLAHNIDEAIMYAEKIGYPVVMKVVSKDILHKSDVGGIALDIMNRKEVIDAYQAIIFNCRQHKPGVMIEGIQVSEMVEPGIEVIVGARRDEIFGPICMFGLGGVYVEVMKDVAFRALPLRPKEVMSMIKEIKSYPLLLGVRGEEKKDVDAIVDVIIKLSSLLQKYDDISDIEINPLVVYEESKGVKAVDIRILLSNVESNKVNGGI